MHYLPHTPEDIAHMLEVIGVDSIDALFADMPQALHNPNINVPAGLDEVSLLNHLRDLAAKNQTPTGGLLGGGTRQHFIPSVTPHLAMQSEFVTAYTPYQPEVAQGLLQATFEYQSMMAELTGLPISNASMYDGASSVAEAALLAVRQTKRKRVVVSTGVHPEAREVMATYLKPLDIAISEVNLEQLTTSTDVISNELGDDVACVIVQNPNFLGYLETMPTLAEATHDVGALFIAVVDPLSLAVLASPAEYGADIAVGDGQVLGNPTNFGGPSFGFMTVTDALLRQLPGRIVGETTDVDGKRAFVLTLQAREQHIRRSKAKSNICSNHQLAALMATVNMAALGPQGLVELATSSVRAAHTLANKLEASSLNVLRGTFFNEFVVQTNRPATDVRRLLAEHNIHAGVPVSPSYGLGDAIILAATELTQDDDIINLVDALSEIDANIDANQVDTPVEKVLEVAHD
ncbi:MAG: aminomethyl-transferring glycine dehydrogenase subunit GcvPA [Deinococcota bacterium]